MHEWVQGKCSVWRWESERRIKYSIKRGYEHLWIRPESRMRTVTCGGLKDWAYASPFRTLDLEVEGAKRNLFPLYIKESNLSLYHVMAVAEKYQDVDVTASLSRLSAFEISFLRPSQKSVDPTSTQVFAPEGGIHAQSQNWRVKILKMS